MVKLRQMVDFLDRYLEVDVKDTAANGLQVAIRVVKGGITTPPDGLREILGARNRPLNLGHREWQQFKSRDPPGQALRHLSVDVELLYLCIQQLSTVDRAIKLLYLEQRTYKEIAEIMGLSRTNVSVRIVRIKERLRTLLLARGYRED